MELKIQDTNELKALIKEGLDQAKATEAKYAKKFNMNETPENEAKLKSAQSKVEVIKFLNALKSEDFATAREITSARAKALSEGTAGAGGYLVPEEFERMLNASYDEFGDIRRNSTVLTMNSDVKRLNELTGKIIVGKVSELNSISDSQPTFGEPVLTTEKYAASTTMSEELLEDSEIDVVSEIARMFGEQLAYAEQNSFINSVVSGSEGILQKSGVNAIKLITGTTFASITFDDLASMQKELFEYNKSEANTAKFYMSMTAYNALRTSKSSGDGNYFYMPAVPTSSAPATAWGREIVVINEMPQTTATATKFVFFADLKRHFFIGDRRGMRIKVNTQGTSAGGTELNYQDAREMVVTKRTAQVVSLPSGIVTLATN